MVIYGEQKHDLTVKKTYFIMKTGEFTMEIVGVIGIFHWDMAFFLLGMICVRKFGSQA